MSWQYSGASDAGPKRVIRIALLGDPSVGKTEIFRWLKEEYLGPIGVDAMPTTAANLNAAMGQGRQADLVNLSRGGGHGAPAVTALQSDHCTRSACTEVTVDEFMDDPEYPYNSDVIRIFRSAKDSTLPSSTVSLAGGTAHSKAPSFLHQHHNQSLQVRSHHNKRYWPTVSPSFYTFEGIAGNTVQIWDVSGQREFSILAFSFPEFRNIDGFVLSYDMTSKSSFDSLMWWHRQFVQARENAIIDEIKARRKNVYAYLKKNGGWGSQTRGSSVSAATQTNTATDTTTDTKQTKTQSGELGASESKARYFDLLREKPSAPPFVVVGTKADFEEGRQISHSSVAEFCDLHQGDENSVIGPARFFEVSARVPLEGAPIMSVLEHLVLTSAAAARDQQRIMGALDAAANGMQPGGTSTKTSGKVQDIGGAGHSAVDKFKLDNTHNQRGCSGGECALQ